MHAVTFNQARMHMFNMASHIKTQESLSLLREQLAAFYANLVDKQVEALWESGEWNEQKTSGASRCTFQNRVQVMENRLVVIDTNLVATTKRGLYFLATIKKFPTTCVLLYFLESIFFLNRDISKNRPRTIINQVRSFCSNMDLIPIFLQGNHGDLPDALMDGNILAIGPDSQFRIGDDHFIVL